MLWVRGQRLGRRNPEEPRIETRDVVDETAIAGVGLVRRIGIGIEQAVQVPAAVSGKLRHDVAAFGHHVPQGLGCIDAAGKAARHADDRDRFARPFQQRAVLALQALDLHQRFAQRLGRMLELISHVAIPRLVVR
ncbi:hypothetical protein MNVI_42970 [Mycobacterium noviomagense]|uniref:Uncharacterized protein n=1 Tax=Mycobacterium noviomagense TaxID=459858 RepID=A0A7I7PKC0_9MYCO|nr:hypothetical protein MNVI_42970 [Mycobacterium noviomagense]